jgi:hypothetical protein
VIIGFIADVSFPDIMKESSDANLNQRLAIAADFVPENRRINRGAKRMSRKINTQVHSLQDIGDFHTNNANEISDWDADIAGEASEVLPIVRRGALSPFCLNAIEQ